jgi:thiosulfate/3-mercaptopyruvate sulfurtransferase
VSRSVSAFVSGSWLEERLGDPSVRIVESSIDRAPYENAHIPGAMWVDHFKDLLRSGDDTSGDVLTPKQFGVLMQRLGITPESTVVAYGDRHNSYAIRLFWTLDYYQHPAPFYVLEGGREKWIAEARPLTDSASEPPAAVYPEPATWTNASRATWQEVQAAIGSPDRLILDVRSQEEYDGAAIRARRNGHIPGAIHVEWTAATDGDNILKAENDLRAIYESRGVTPDKEIIVHCQLGIRAAHTWFVLKHVLGYENVKNYDGSWAEWGNRDDLPIESAQ